MFVNVHLPTGLKAAYRHKSTAWTGPYNCGERRRSGKMVLVAVFGQLLTSFTVCSSLQRELHTLDSTGRLNVSPFGVNTIAWGLTK